MGEARRRKQLDPTYGKPKERIFMNKEDFKTQRAFTIEDYQRMGRSLFPESLLRRFDELMDSEQLIPDETYEWNSSTPYAIRCALSWDEGVNCMKPFIGHIHHMTLLKSFCIASIGISDDEDL